MKYSIIEKSSSLLYNEETVKVFLNELVLKNPKYSLYAYAEVIDGELFVKFGEAKKETIYQRYNTAGHLANKHMIQIWESEKRDKTIHNWLKKFSKNRDYSWAEKDALNSVEAYKIDKPEGLTQLLNDISTLAETNGIIEHSYRPDYPNVIELVNEIISANKEKYNLDLCARWGKTSTVLRLSNQYKLKENIKVFVMASYVGTVKTSYSHEIVKLTNNKDCMFFDPDNYSNSATMLNDINNWLSDPSHYIMYYVALTGDEDNRFEKRTNVLRLLNLPSVVYIEEADFGAHCDKQVKKIMSLYKNIKGKHILSMTGTNSEKCEKIFTPDITLRRDYILDVLPIRHNAVGIDWTVLNNENMVKVFGYSSDEMENFSDMTTVVDGKLKNETWFRQFFNFLFNKNIPNVSKETRKYTKHSLLREGATIIFTPRGNDGHSAMGNLLKDVCGNSYKIRILDGRETSNEDCEREALEAIRTYGTKVIFIAYGIIIFRSTSN